jgi:hypothetical protein
MVALQLPLVCVVIDDVRLGAKISGTPAAATPPTFRDWFSN